MNDPYLYEVIRRAIMGPQSGPVILSPAPTNVTDFRTRKPYYQPGTLARTLGDISDAFTPVPSDG